MLIKRDADTKLRGEDISAAGDHRPRHLPQPPGLHDRRRGARPGAVGPGGGGPGQSPAAPGGEEPGLPGAGRAHAVQERDDLQQLLRVRHRQGRSRRPRARRSRRARGRSRWTGSAPSRRRSTSRSCSSSRSRSASIACAASRPGPWSSRGSASRSPTLLKRVEPTAQAKYVRVHRRSSTRRCSRARSAASSASPSTGRTSEGLRLDEAMHPLTLVTVGLYGQVLPNQNGAPLRVVVPWKYGFKSGKSIVRIRLTVGGAQDLLEQGRAAASTASTRTSTPRSATRAGARRPSGASASCAAATRSCSTATATRSRRCTRGWI